MRAKKARKVSFKIRNVSYREGFTFNTFKIAINIRKCITKKKWNDGASK